MRPKILIAITCYNCEKQISRLIDEISTTPALTNQIDRFLFIDNRSKDGTLNAIIEGFKKYKDLSSKVIVIQNSENYGLGGSQKIAFKYAKENGFEILVVLHGDHQARYPDLSKLLLNLDSHPNLIAVLGSRFSWKSKTYGYSKIRIFGNLVINFIYSIVCRRWIVDLGSGLNLFKIQEFNLDQVNRCNDQFSFNMDLLLLLVRSQKFFYYIPIRWIESDQKSNAKNMVVGIQAILALKNSFLNRQTIVNSEIAHRSYTIIKDV